MSGYLATYTDVKAAGINPLDHYNSRLARGPRSVGRLRHDLVSRGLPGREGRGTSIRWSHFLENGIDEGRSPFADGVWG